MESNGKMSWDSIHFLKSSRNTSEMCDTRVVVTKVQCKVVKLLTNIVVCIMTNDYKLMQYKTC